MVQDLTKNFSRSEFACKDNCGFNTVDYALVLELQRLRDTFGPIKINSACRCEAHNRAVGGGEKSQHLLGRAADIVCARQLPANIYAFLDDTWKGGLGRYPTFTHIDSRSGKARWG